MESTQYNENHKYIDTVMEGKYTEPNLPHVNYIAFLLKSEYVAEHKLLRITMCFRTGILLVSA